MDRHMRIGTRKSPLAVQQAEHIRGLLEAAIPGVTCSLVLMVTKGDKMLDAPLAKVGGKGLFVSEIESALLRGECDLAVHSMKDLPAQLHEGLVLAAIPPREDPRDVLVCRDDRLRLHTLPSGACLGTSSLRRTSLLLHVRDDLRIIASRGNVGTRLRRLDEGRFDALVMAMAGLKRLGLTDRITEVLPEDICLPAVGQGALAIECRASDEEIRNMLQRLHDPTTAVAITAERAFLAGVQGDCRVPVACHGTLADGTLRLTGLVAGLDGEECIRRTVHGNAAEAARLGRSLADEILAAGGKRLLDEIRTE